MEVLGKNLFFVLFGLSGGFVSAAGVFALLTTVRLVNRFAIVTRTASRITRYEDMVIAGVVAGNLLSVYAVYLPGGLMAVGLWGLISGIYVGCFAVALAETIKVMPILARRSRLKEGMGIIILCMASGKAIGSLMYFFFGNFMNY